VTVPRHFAAFSAETSMHYPGNINTSSASACRIMERSRSPRFRAGEGRDREPVHAEPVRAEPAHVEPVHAEPAPEEPSRPARRGWWQLRK
jgi:hypothetical protein